MIRFALLLQVDLVDLNGYDVTLSGMSGNVVATQGQGYHCDRRVDLAKNECTCTLFQQCKFPCRHAIAYARYKDRGAMLDDSVAWYTDFFAPCYRCSRLERFYFFGHTL